MVVEDSEIAEVFSQAVMLEADGFEFYTELSGKVADLQVGTIFSYLADEERDHKTTIELMFEERLPGYFKDFLEEYEGGASTLGVFRKFDSEEVEKTSDILEAVEIGIAAEEMSINLYRQLESNMTDDELKEVLGKLAKEEEKHLSLLQEQKPRLNQK